MNYIKPFGRFIEFDNSDIIVTSKLEERTCNRRVAGIVCNPNADDSLANECNRPGVADYVPGQYFCFILEWDAPPPGTKCDPSAGNHDFTNVVINPPM